MTRTINSPSADFDYDGFDLESLADLHRYQQWIISHFEPYISGAVVELGAGSGAISFHLIEKSDSLILVEPSTRHAEILQHRFAETSKVSIVCGSLEEQTVQFPEASVDSIVMVNVLEHIEDDRAALIKISRSLKPGAYLMIMVPALPFLFSNMDTRLGHHRRYLSDQLQEILRATGFAIITARYMDMIGIIPWWLINTVAGKTDFNPFLLQLYDAVFVPLSRYLEALIKPPLGKNIVIVAQRMKTGTHDI